MIRGNDLGEGFGLGAVGLVAAGADDGGVELRRRHGGGVVGMPGLGSMTGFARNDYVAALFFLLDHVGMTGLAGCVAGEGDGAGSGLGDGSAAIVSILTKAFGDDEGAQADEGNHCDCYHRRDTDEMFDVFEQVVAPDAGRELRAICAMLLDNLESSAER